MKWKTPFIVYRITAGGKLEEVFHCYDLKKAKYWLSYIAQIGDVLCRTPLHPKHSKKTNAAEYFQHKEDAGKTMMSEELWKKTKQGEANFPEEQLQESTEL